MRLVSRLVAASATLAIAATGFVALSRTASAAEEVYPAPASGS